MSGAQPVAALKWELWKPGSSGGMSPPMVGQNNAHGCAGDKQPNPMGAPKCGCEPVANANACAAACEAAANCTSATCVAWRACVCSFRNSSAVVAVAVGMVVVVVVDGGGGGGGVE